MVLGDRCWTKSPAELVEDAKSQILSCLPEHREVTARQVESEDAIHPCLADIEYFVVVGQHQTSRVGQAIQCKRSHHSQLDVHYEDRTSRILDRCFSPRSAISEV